MRTLLVILALGWMMAIGHVAIAAEAVLVPREVPSEVAREVAVGNLSYAKTKTSKCFSDAFVAGVAKRVAVTVRPGFVAIRSDQAEQLSSVAFAVMTGEGSFTLAEIERTNLHQWLDHGGFLLASAGCSSKEWTASFRAEITRMFGEKSLVSLASDHPLFRTLNDLTNIPLRHDGAARFEGLILDGRLACLFSPEGLNDTAHVNGCCCCGGNEVVNAEAVVSNALVYALVE